MQSSNFDHAGTSFMLSIATIPWLGKSFTGCLCAFLCKGELHRFTTYKGVRINRVDTSGDRIAVELKQREFTIHVDARKTWCAAYFAGTGQHEWQDRRVADIRDSPGKYTKAAHFSLKVPGPILTGSCRETEAKGLVYRNKQPFCLI